jgi:nucleoporin NUP159
VFEASDICSPGDNEVSPLHTFLSTTPAPTAVRQMYANPGDIPELVAILREPDGSPNSQLVEVINVSTMQSVAGWNAGGTPETFPTSGSYNPLFSLRFSLSVYLIVSWSPKGKQLAIALQSGDIITFSPSETQQAKSFVARPPSMQGQSIIHATWLSNPAFYTIFAPAGSLDPQVDQKHMVIVHDAKRPNTSADVFLPINFFPSGVRPPGAFTITLRGWDPAKILLLVGDSTTADIGLVCCTTDDKWQKLAFDEGAPSMPLDAEQNETTMIGFELDLKNTTPYDVTTSTGETVSVPPPPVVWAYASDGTVTAWYVVNTRGTPYPSMGQATTPSPVSAPAAPAPTSPFSQAAQPAFGQTSPSSFGQPSQPSLAFSSAGSTLDQPAFGQASVPGSTFGQRPTFGSPAFTQTSAGSTFGQPSSSGQAPSGEGFASFASAPVKWGQSNFGSTVSSFSSASAPGPPPQIQPSESTESMSTDSGQDLSFSGMSLGEGTNDTQLKAGSGTTGMFGSPAPVTQSAAPATTSAFGSGSFNLSPGVGAFSKFVPRQIGDAPNVPTVEVPKASPAFGQSGFGAPAFGQSGFGQSAGQSAFGKTGLGTPMSTTPIVTPVSTTSPSFGSGGAFSAFASGGPATLSGSKPAETKLAPPTMSGGGAFGAFASSGPSGFGQAASTTAGSVPAWKTGGDSTFGGGTGSSVFGGKSSTTPVVSAATPAKSLFASAEPAPSTTPAFPPPTTTSLEKPAPPSAGATPLTPPSGGATPSRGSQSPPDEPTAPTSPLTASDLIKPTVPPESTTPAGPPPVPNAFMGLKMSTGFGLSNFNAKDSPFANPKPVSQTVSAFGGGQPPAPKMPVPATPGSVFGQTSTIGTAAKAVSAFGRPAFDSPTTPTAAAKTTPSSSQTESSSAFSAFTGTASAFGKAAGSGASFSEMLRHAGSSPDSKSKEVQAKGSSETGPSPPTPKSVFDKSPTPRPASIPAAPESEDEEDGDKDKGKARQVLSAESSFSNLSSSTSSFVDVPRGGEEEEEGAVASDGSDGEQQIEEFLSGTDSEGEGHEEEEEEEESEGEREEHEEDEEEEEEEESDDEENKIPSPAEADPTTVPLPKSRSPSSTPKAERPVINVEPTISLKPEPEPSTTSRVESTTPPGSPSTAPLQQPTPMLPSPSQTPSPSPSSTSSSLGRPSTRPLRSSPLANAPVSGGDEEEVKGENPTSLKPRPASPKTPFGKWDGIAKAPSPTPPPIILEPSVEQATKTAPPSLIPRPKSPPLLTTKGTPLDKKPSSSLVTGPAATPPALGSGWIGFSLGGSGPKPDTKLTAEDATKPTTTTTPSLFTGIKLEAGTEAPAALDSKVAPGPLFGTKPLAVSGTTTPKLPLTPPAGPSSLGNLPVAMPGVMTPAMSANDVLTPPRTPGATSLITPPKETASAEPMVPMQVEFAALYTEVQTEIAAVR